MADNPGITGMVSYTGPDKPKPIDPLAVQQAKAAGYSDQEIADHLAQTNPEVHAARAAGYQDDEIVQHLATPPADNSAVHGFIAGALKPLDNLTNAAMHIPGMATLDRWGQAIGLQSEADAAGHNELARQGNTRTGYQMAGNVAGTLPTLALPGGMAVQGAAGGALLSDKHDATGLVTDAGLGAAGSLVGGKLLEGIGALAKPVASKAANVLHDAGIPLSLGQLAESTGTRIGAAVRSVEDKARSVPVLGSLISGSRSDAATALNHAVANNALSPIGKTVPKAIPAGHELLDHVEQQLSDKYQQVVPHLVGHVDQQFAVDLTAAKAKTNVLPATRQAQFETIVRDVFTNRMQNGTTISGQSLKDAESRLTKLAKDYRSSPDPDQRILGEAVGDVRQALRTMAIRSNPQSGQTLQGINTGWARLKQAQAASDQNGVITPGRLVRASNRSGQGTELARAASQLMPDHVPNSGTADRVLLSQLGKFLLGGGAGYAAASHPEATAAAGTLAGLAAIPYTRLGTKALNAAAFASRPQVVQHAGSLAQFIAKGAPVTVPPLLARQRGP